jgi:SulP family sulfate permease
MRGPKLFYTLKTYTRSQFYRDAIAGVIVGIVALPLSIAFAIASGVSPEKGLYTAVIAGFFISFLGGSRVQIGGPTGAFIVIVYGIVQEYGVNGLILATFIAGVMLLLMGLAQLGTFIRFIPHPLIVGFTSGIALIIFSSQVKDFFGLNVANLPADFIGKWEVAFRHLGTVNWYAVGLALLTVVLIQLWPRVTHRVPGSLVAIVIATAVAQAFHLPVETIGSRFGSIPNSLPTPVWPDLDFQTIRHLIQPAFTIALLGAIESLLSAVVADGMIASTTRSNIELVGQGVGNMASALFGGIPATGAIARTATNVKNGGRTPVAGMIHAVTLLIIMLFAAPYAEMIPMSVLAGILVVVAYNMSEWHNFLTVLKGPVGDRAVLLTTFLLTVLIDLTVAIQIGMVLAVFVFMRSMTRSSDVKMLNASLAASAREESPEQQEWIPEKGIEVFEVSGPLFFGAAYKFKEALKLVEAPPKVLIIRLDRVPMIDATGIRILQDVHQQAEKQGTKILLAELTHGEVWDDLQKARLLFAIGKGNIFKTYPEALKHARQLLTVTKQKRGS